MLWILWIGMGVLVALIANSFGRSAFKWFIYGVLIWPAALAHLLVSGPIKAGAAAQAGRDGRSPCPFCAEDVKFEASVCPRCQRNLPKNWWWPKVR